MGFTKEDVEDVLEHLSKHVGEAFMYEILTELPKDKLAELEKSMEDGSLDEDARLEMLADFYTESTGISPLERTHRMLREYVSLFIRSLRKIKAFNEKTSKMPAGDLAKLDKVLKNKDWDKIKSVLDEIGLEESDFLV